MRIARGRSETARELVDLVEERVNSEPSLDLFLNKIKQRFIDGRETERTRQLEAERKEKRATYFTSVRESAEAAYRFVSVDLALQNRGSHYAADIKVRLQLPQGVQFEPSLPLPGFPPFGSAIRAMSSQLRIPGLRTLEPWAAFQVEAEDSPERLTARCKKLQVAEATALPLRYLRFDEPGRYEVAYSVVHDQSRERSDGKLKLEVVDEWAVPSIVLDAWRGSIKSW